jgi:hypothetical protein
MQLYYSVTLLYHNAILFSKSTLKHEQSASVLGACVVWFSYQHPLYHIYVLTLYVLAGRSRTSMYIPRDRTV